MSTASTALARLSGGFARPVFDAQTSFRVTLEALARPGCVQTIPVSLDVPNALHVAAGAIALALFDQDTPVWLSPALDGRDTREFLAFHCGCPLVAAPGGARFALADGWSDLPPLATFDGGAEHYPDRSCTVIIQVTGFDSGMPLQLDGPGIATSQSLRISGCDEDFVAQWRRNRDLFPRGVDLLCVHDDRLVGLPRTTRITPHR